MGLASVSWELRRNGLSVRVMLVVTTRPHMVPWRLDASVSILGCGAVIGAFHMP